MKTNEELKQQNNLLVQDTALDGGKGIIYKFGKEFASVIWSTGLGWDHVSIAPYKKSVIPTWDDMCRLKDMFFYEEETVVQYHPAKSKYINHVPNCLHLWKPNEGYISDGGTLPIPPEILV